MVIELSLFAHGETGAHENVKFESWRELINGWDSVAVTDKLKSPAFSPCTFLTPHSKKKKDALTVSCGVLDIDGIAVAELVTWLKKYSKYQRLVYTTVTSPQHEKVTGNIKCRVMFPLSRPVMAVEWVEFWPRMMGFLNAGAYVDTKCATVCHVYFCPGHFKGDEKPTIAGVPEGIALPVDDIMNTPRAVFRGCNDAPTLKGLRSKAKGTYIKGAIDLLLEARSFALEGERDDTLYKMLRWVWSGWPNATVDEVVALFTGSMGVMKWESMDFIRAKAEYTKEQAEELEADTGLAYRISEAFDNGRKHPYTPEELASFAEQQGTTLAKFRTRWLLQYGPTVYVYFNGQYRLHTRDDWYTAAETLLAPAASAGVSIAGENGKPLPKALLMGRYGSVIIESYVDLLAKHHHYRKSDQCFVEATSPVRPLPPLRDTMVAKWLELMASENHALLLSWLAASGQLRQPCVALVLLGPPGIGKSLMGHGLSRLWTKNGPTELAQAMGSFNEAVCQCPLVFADEDLPRDFRGQPKTQELRALIQATRQPLRRKFRPDSHVQGAVRVVIAANNENILNLSGELNIDDLNAIAGRFLVLHCPKETGDYLRGLSCGGSTFVTEDRLAQHVLWLQENHIWTPQGRFLVEPDTRTLTQQLIMRSDIPSTILHAVSHWLRSGAPERAGIYVHDDSVRVKADALLPMWRLVCDLRAPLIGKVARALSTLASRRAKGRDGGNYKVLRKNTIAEWCETTGFMSLAEINTAFANAQKEDKKASLN